MQIVQQSAPISYSRPIHCWPHRVSQDCCLPLPIPMMINASRLTLVPTLIHPLRSAIRAWQSYPSINVSGC